MIKEYIPEEPHRVFIALPETAIKKELFAEELPDSQDHPSSDEVYKRHNSVSYLMPFICIGKFKM